jgi:hypothetical protein
MLTPQGRYAIAVTGAARRARREWRRADGRGRLTVSIDLGSAARRATVRIAAAPAAPARLRSGTIG